MKLHYHEKTFYSNITMERITNTDYEYSKSFWYDFGLQNIDQYHDLYVQSDTLLLADIFGCGKKNAQKLMNYILLVFFLYPTGETGMFEEYSSRVGPMISNMPYQIYKIQ